MSEAGLQLDLKKPLDKMTAKELRELVIGQIPQITGASGLGKEELLVAIKEVLGIGGEEGGSVSPYKGKILSMKKDIREMREKKASMSEAPRKDREILRRKINKLKKRTRRLAVAK